jgi:hypothetical protein
MRTILVCLNDTHAGHRLGLMNPEVQLPDWTIDGEHINWAPKPTATQEYLWRTYVTDLQCVRDISDGAPIGILHTGDETQGDKYIQSWVSSRKADQYIIAAWNFAPLLMLPNVRWFRLALGTPAHDFGEGTSTTIITQTLTDRFPQIDTKAVRHGLLRYNDVWFDYAHHGPGPGIRDWTRGNVAQLYLRSLLSSALKRGDLIPDVVLRAHFHTPVSIVERVRDRVHKDVYLYVVPSLCGLDGYAQQVTQSKDKITNGLLVLELEDGRILREHELYHTLDLRTKEIIQ